VGGGLIYHLCIVSTVVGVELGWHCGRLYLSATVVAEAVFDVRRAVRRLRGWKPRETREMREGRWWHEKLGYTNRRMYTGEMDVDGVTVVLYGVPDRVDGMVEELKTVRGRHVPGKKLLAGRVQLAVYLFLTGAEVGKLVFVDRETGEEVYSEFVFRDDELVKEYIRKIIKEERTQRSLATVVS